MSELYHHGIPGQKWGVKNGPPYPIKKVFVSGSSKTQTKDSGYYRHDLPKEIQNELTSHVKRGSQILVGDAPGIDRQVQDFLKSYKNVIVYSPGNKNRYLANKDWKNVKMTNSKFEEGSDEWLSEKDIKMAKDATEGLAIILDKGSQATRNNIQRLINDNKNVKIYQLSGISKDLDGWIKHI